MNWRSSSVACAARAALRRLSPDYLARNLRVEFDPAQTDAAAIVQSIESAGFPAQEAATANGIETGDIDCIAGTAIDSAHRLIVGGLLLIAATVVRFIAGATTWPVRCASHRFRHRLRHFGGQRRLASHSAAGLDMNVLMTVAATGAIAIGDYFEAATAMLLFAVSLWLERLSLTRAENADSLAARTRSDQSRIACCGAAPRQKRRRRKSRGAQNRRACSGAPRRTNSRRRRSAVRRIGRQSSSHHRRKPAGRKTTGDQVFAGTLNGEGSLVLKVTALGQRYDARPHRSVGRRSADQPFADANDLSTSLPAVTRRQSLCWRWP